MICERRANTALESSADNPIAKRQIGTFQRTSDSSENPGFCVTRRTKFSTRCSRATRCASTVTSGRGAGVSSTRCNRATKERQALRLQRQALRLRRVPGSCYTVPGSLLPTDRNTPRQNCSSRTRKRKSPAPNGCLPGAFGPLVTLGVPGAALRGDAPRVVARYQLGTPRARINSMSRVPVGRFGPPSPSGGEAQEGASRPIGLVLVLALGCAHGQDLTGGAGMHPVGRRCSAAGVL